MRQLIFTVIMIFSLGAFLPVIGSTEKPNIVIFLVDDMGLMDTSVPMMVDADGKPKRYPLNDWYRTPNMERMAAQGIRFTDFYAHSVCSPTRASIMTGQNSARHRTTNWIHLSKNNGGRNGPPEWNWSGLKQQDITLPRILQEVGYKTIHIGKAHFGPLGTAGADPVNLGFDVNIGGNAAGGPQSYYGEENYGKGRPVPHLEKYHGSGIFLTEALTLEAISEIDSALEEDRPFYLYMSHYAVHAPFCSDPRFASHYVDSGKGEPAEAFATLIEGMDKSLGDLMDHLEAVGVADNTLIIFLGDNGSASPLNGKGEIASSEPLRGKKGRMWEGGLRVPFIAAWAKPNLNNPWQQKLPIELGGIQEQMGACYDLFPTLVDLVDAYVPPEHQLDGQTLKTLFTGKPDRFHQSTFLSHFPHPRTDNYYTSYRSGDWKIIYHYFPAMNKRVSSCSLYNLADDPAESNDVAKQNPEKVSVLLQAMVKDLHAKGALFPVDDQAQVVVPKFP
ncbi:sulfatase [Coraliomargarita sp. W4R53]